MKRVPLSEIESNLSRLLRRAAGEEIVITRNGKPAGVVIGFGSEDDWLDHQRENDPPFFAGSSRRERAHARSAVSGSRMSSENLGTANRVNCRSNAG